MYNAFFLQLINKKVDHRYHLQVHTTISYRQLHEAMLVLYHWKDDQPFTFYLDNHKIAWNEEMLNVHCYRNVQLTYSRGSGNDTIWIQIRITPSKTTLYRSIQYLDQINNYCSMVAIQKQLDGILPFDKVNYDHDIAKISESLREQLMCQSVIAPYLILIKMDHILVPFYIDMLDDAMELMIFPDMQVFTRSILYAEKTDPDLLFTYAYTIDFFYDDIEETRLPLYHSHNLCYKNMPGKLPSGFDITDQIYLIQLLNMLYERLRNQKLPMLKENQVVIIEDTHMEIHELNLMENDPPLYLNSEDRHRFISYPHTNEHIHLMLQAVPKTGENTADIEVKLCAVNEHFYKECIVHTEAIDRFHHELYTFIMQLCMERGLAERYHLYSCNLYHIIAALLKELDIPVSLHTHEAWNMRKGMDLFTSMTKGEYQNKLWH